MTEASELIRAIAALAWPVAIVVSVLLFRPQLKELMSDRLKRVQAGPFSAEWEQAAADVQTEVEQAGAPTSDQVEAIGALTATLADRIAAHPSAAVYEAHARVEDRLRQLLAEANAPDPVRRGDALKLAKGLRRRNLITDEAARAVEGLSVMRNLVAHRDEEVSPEQAREYLALADGVLFALGHRPSA